MCVIYTYIYVHTHTHTHTHTFAETVEGNSLCLVTTMIVRGLKGTQEDNMTVSSPASATLRA